jgi:hypothetical protein
MLALQHNQCSVWSSNVSQRGQQFSCRSIGRYNLPILHRISCGEH